MRSHYLPRFYLQKFTDPQEQNYVYMYEKGNSCFKKVSPRDICIQKDYYAFIDKEGNYDKDTIEKGLASVENTVAPLLGKIEEEQFLSKEEKADVANFIALCMVRVPNFRNGVDDAAAQLMKKINEFVADDQEKFRATMKQYEEATSNEIKTSKEDIRQFMLSGEYDLEFNPEFSLEIALDTAKELAGILFSMNWAFLKVHNETRFATCDNPVSYRDPTYSRNAFDGVGLLNENVEVTFPISRDVAILAGWDKIRDNTYQVVKDRTARKVNRMTVKNALRFVFYCKHSKVFSNFVQKYKDSAPRWKVG